MQNRLEKYQSLMSNVYPNVKIAINTKQPALMYYSYPSSFNLFLALFLMLN